MHRNQPRPSSSNGELDTNANIAAKAVDMFLNTGQIGKASDRITDPVVPLSYENPNIAEQVNKLLRTEPPIAQSDLVDTTDPQPPAFSEEAVAHAVSELRNSASGITGWSPQLIKFVASSTQGLAAVTFIINQIFSKQLPNSIYMGVSRQLLIILSMQRRTPRCQTNHDFRLLVPPNGVVCDC